MIDPSTGEMFSLNLSKSKWKAIYNVGFHDILPVESHSGIENYLNRYLNKNPEFGSNYIRKSNSKKFSKLIFKNLKSWKFLKKEIQEGSK